MMEEDAKSLVDENGKKLLSVLAAVLAVLIILFVLWCKRRMRRSILLVGLSGSGKTLIYLRIVHNKFVKTNKSIKENTAQIAYSYGSWRIVDIPGDERLRQKYFDKYKLFANGLIFVIDSVRIQEEVRDATDYLYNILSDPDIVRRKIPILILCNKQDQTMSKTHIVVKAFLEREIYRMRQTKSEELQATGASTADFAYLGQRKKVFELKDVNLEIDFAESYAFNNNPETPFDLDQLEEWLHKIA